MIIKVLILVLLIIINGIFSATEIAFLSINKYELSKAIKNKNKKAIKIASLINDSSTFLSAIQVVITLSGFLASAFAAENFASELASLINVEFLSYETLTTILVVIITLILSYFTLVFGELVPKKIGLAYSMKISFSMVNIISLVIKVFKPFILILKYSTDFIVKLLKIKTKEENMEDDIKNSIVDSSLEELEKQMLLNVFQFNDTNLSDVMTPKDEVIAIDINISQEDLMKIIKKYKYTRFPIFKDNKIIGILNVKDLIMSNKKVFDLNSYIRNVPYLNFDMIIDDAFLYLNSHYEAMAIVIKDNQYIGIVTIEDIVEDVIGNIFDEYDENISQAQC